MCHLSPSLCAGVLAVLHPDLKVHPTSTTYPQVTLGVYVKVEIENRSDFGLETTRRDERRRDTRGTMSPRVGRRGRDVVHIVSPLTNAV